MIAVWALLKGLPWRLIGAVGLVVAVALAGWRIATWRDGYQRAGQLEAALEAERDCRPDTRCAERLRGWQADGLAAVEQARRAAQEAAEREQARRAAEAQAEANRLAAATRDAQAKADAWRRKFEAAKRQPECKAWAEQPVSCPSS